MNPSKSIFLALFKEEIAKGEKHICEPELVYEMRYGVINTYRCTNPACKYHDSDNGVFISELNIPDYTTASGFFELKALCEKQSLLHEIFLVELYKKRPEIKLEDCGGKVSSAVIGLNVWLEITETPLTFATAVYDFLKERGDIK